MTDEVPESPHEQRSADRRADRSSRFLLRRPRGSTRGGARARRHRRRAQGLGSTLGLTALGAVVPGSGYLVAGRRWLGGVVLLGWLGTIAALVWYFSRGTDAALDFVFNPAAVRAAAIGLAVGLLVWAFVVVTSHRLLRPRERPRSHTIIGNVMVVVLLLAGAAPIARAAQYAMATADGVGTVFDPDPDSPTAPKGVTEEDPWAGRDRVNVLLLGGDAGDDRVGVRTDSVILASIDTKTGRTTLFSLPRNMMYAEFPEDSPLHTIYPDGFQTFQGDPGFDMLNAIYGQVPALYPHILGKSENEGADAVKQAVAGSLGTHVDYYVLINLHGFRQLVDAVGGVTVNINERVAINGNTDAGIPPTGFLEPGPDQHLDGFQALWFSRGRWGSDDYKRMLRQRCMVSALVDAADPLTVLTRYQELASAGKEILRTDVPRELMPAFVDLALKVKERPMRSMAFVSSKKFFSGDPDFPWMQAVVAKAIGPRKARAASKAGTPVETQDACRYQPEQTTE